MYVHWLFLLHYLVWIVLLANIKWSGEIIFLLQAVTASAVGTILLISAFIEGWGFDFVLPSPTTVVCVGRF